MGWDYEHRIAYGVTIKSWGNVGLKEFIKDNNDFIQYDKEMSLKGPGTLFIYFISTYKVLARDHGSYSFKFPDISGDEFNPPKHPIIHKKDSNMAVPDLTDLEQDILNQLKNLFELLDISWVIHSNIWN
jgi:hypothetical protein